MTDSSAEHSVYLSAAAVSYVSRQPIFNERGEVLGYELLYRAPPPAADERGPEAACARLYEAIGENGLTELVGGKALLVPFDDSLLACGITHVIPRAHLLILIREDVVATRALIELLRTLRRSGIRVVLEGADFEGDRQVWLPLADLVRIDLAAAGANLAAITARLRAVEVPMLAEKVYTHEEERLCRSLGIQYLQGFYFTQPMSLGAGPLGGAQRAALRVITELSRGEQSLGELARVVGRDARLARDILRLANSATHRSGRNLATVGDALIVLGEDTVRHWASLLLLARLAPGKPEELLSLALTRGRLCEWFAADAAELGVDATMAFTTGLLSVLDALLDRSMESIVAELDLVAELRAPLLGETASPLGSLLERAMAYERGEWDGLLEDPTREPRSIIQTYVDALAFARATHQGTRTATP